MIKNVVRITLLSEHESNNQNKPFYSLLPDGNTAFLAAPGHLEGSVWYMQLVLKAYVEAQSNKYSKYSDLVQRLNITSILPNVDLVTGQTNKNHSADVHPSLSKTDNGGRVTGQLAMFF